MNSAQRLAKGFQLGEWTVRPEDGSLTSSDAATRLEPLSMELLIFLCSRSGQVVTKDEVLKSVWRGRFVSDDTVKASFYQLRKALRDSPRKPRFIETLPKRGYRILVKPVPLEPSSDDAGPGNAADLLYSKGQALLSGQPNATTLKQARLYFERAIEGLPDHAPAAAALAHVYIQLVSLGMAKGSELFPRAKALAVRALEIDPKLASAHSALGIAKLLYERDTESAERSFRAAIDLDPGDAAAHRWYAKLLSFRNRHEEAIAEARRALLADPLSLALRRDLIEALFMARHYEEAIAEAQQSLQMAGHAPDIQLGLAWIYYLLHDEEKAFAACREGFRSLGTAPEVLEGTAKAYRRGGMREVLRLWAQIMKEQAALGQRTVDLLVLYALVDEKDRAFELIDWVLRESLPALLWLPASPFFDTLRSDPRYKRALSRLRSADR